MPKLQKILILISFIFFIIYKSNSQQQDGYTLYSVMGSKITNLIDTNGNSFKTWNHTDKSGYSCYLMPGPYLWRSVSRTGNSFSGGPINGQVQKIDWNGNIIWNFVYSTYDYCTHHDICPLPNGNVLLIAYERKSASEVSAAGCTFIGEVWSEKVVEIKPTGATTGDVVWEWKVWDHIIQNKDSTKKNYYKSILSHPELLNVNYKTSKDWIHMNGIDYNPILDQIAVSSHNLNEWYIIDHSTTTTEAASHSGGNSGKGGDFIYRWGNPLAYDASGTQVLKVTHDVHWIPEGIPNEGRLVGFNNNGVSSSKSSVDQIDPPTKGYNYDFKTGTAYEPSTYYRHQCNGYTSNAGSSDQLKNGNMLVCIALSANMYEIDVNQKSIWSKTVTGSIQQAHHYDKCFVNNEAPKIPIISIKDDTLTSTEATSYQWYFNGEKLNGKNSQYLIIGKNGNYLVRTSDNNDCIFQYSNSFKVNSFNKFKVIADAEKISICKGDSVKITAITNNENGVSNFLWFSNPAGFSSNSKSIKVSPQTSTIYTVIANNNGIIDTSNIEINVIPLPTKPEIILWDNSLISSKGETYKWYFNNELISETSQIIYPSKSGNYSVKISNTSGCFSTMSDNFYFNVSGIENPSLENGIIIYPNPANSYISIYKNQNLIISKIYICDFTGKNIHEYSYSEKINIENLNAGFYFIKFKTLNYVNFTFKLNICR